MMDNLKEDVTVPFFTYIGFFIKTVYKRFLFTSRRMCIIFGLLFVTSRIHQAKRKVMNTYVFVSSYIIITVLHFRVCRAFIQIRKMCMEGNAYTCV